MFGGLLMYFSIYFRIGNCSLSINSEGINVLRWSESEYFESHTIFQWDFKQKQAVKSYHKPAINPVDDDFDPIPF